MIEFTVPERDQREVARVINMIDYRMRDARKPGIVLVATFIIMSLRAATKIAPRVRRIIDMGSATMRKHATLESLMKGGRARFQAVAYQKKVGTWLVPLYGAKTREEARLHKRAQVPRQGWAKDAWGVMMREFAGDINGGPTGIGVRWEQVRKYTRVSKDFTGDATIKLDVNLRYAYDAFRTKGKSTVDGVIRRGANAARKWLERELGVKIPQGNMA